MPQVAGDNSDCSETPEMILPTPGPTRDIHHLILGYPHEALGVKVLHC